MMAMVFPHGICNELCKVLPDRSARESMLIDVVDVSSTQFPRGEVFFDKVHGLVLRSLNAEFVHHHEELKHQRGVCSISWFVQAASINPPKEDFKDFGVVLRESQLIGGRLNESPIERCREKRHVVGDDRFVDMVGHSIAWWTNVDCDHLF